MPLPDTASAPSACLWHTYLHCACAIHLSSGHHPCVTLLSDVFLHLVPHSFLGESQGASVCFVLMEEKRNILVSLVIFIRFVAYQSVSCDHTHSLHIESNWNGPK